MKFLKSHLSLILALFAVLLSIETYTLFEKIIKKYETKIINEYTILAVSTQEIKTPPIPEVSKIEIVDVSSTLLEVKSRMKELNVTVLKQKLPHFYRFSLSTYPTPEKLKKIEKSLKNLTYIKRIEAYRDTQNTAYNLLLLISNISQIFTVITLFIALLLIIKQMQVWKLEHNERIYIMELFGAPFWLRGGVLLKMALFDSLLATLMTTLLLYISINSAIYKETLLQLSVTVDISYLNESLLFFSLAFGISLFSTIVVTLSKSER